MTMGQGQKDLYVLVADQDMLQTMEKLLDREKSLGIRPIEHKIERHFQRDPGCRTDVSRYLRHRTSHYQYALVVFDREGCGDDASARRFNTKSSKIYRSKVGRIAQRLS